MNVQGQPQAANRAGGSSFYLAMRILKREQREAMFEIYSFCRQVDDIADSDALHPQRVAGLSEWRKNIDALYSGSNGPGLDGLAKTIVRFDLRKADFLAVIDGVEMDARADICAPSMDELDLYCDRVASAVGRLSVRIFGMSETEGQSLAYHLGRALQLTNILRDIDEDAEVGRLYLPREALQLADINTTDIQSILSNPRLGTACAFIVDRARAHFAKADEIMASCPRQVVRAPKIMGAVYRQMLEDMVSRGWSRPRNRVHMNKSHLLWIALRHAFV
ncbi:MAG TPA: presqualene diphosphate synthase HpnD [Pseudolabrys sp.]|nr:presqualene diphosphate synthase HpnD [Pseudolabrys sp.]